MHRSPQHVRMVCVSALGGCACGKEAARCALAESTAVAALGLPGPPLHWCWPLRVDYPSSAMPVR